MLTDFKQALKDKLGCDFTKEQLDAALSAAKDDVTANYLMLGHPVYPDYWFNSVLASLKLFIREGIH